MPLPIVSTNKFLFYLKQKTGKNYPFCTEITLISIINFKQSFKKYIKKLLNFYFLSELK